MSNVLSVETLKYRAETMAQTMDYFVDSMRGRQALELLKKADEHDEQRNALLAQVAQLVR